MKSVLKASEMGEMAMVCVELARSKFLNKSFCGRKMARRNEWELTGGKLDSQMLPHLLSLLSISNS